MQGRRVFLGAVLLLFLVSSVFAVAISPGSKNKEIIFQPNKNMSLSFWAVNIENETKNWSVGTDYELSPYLTPCTNYVIVPPGSESHPSSTQFKVNLSLPAYLSPGKHIGAVSLLECSGGGGIGACVQVECLIKVYSSEPIINCQKINYKGVYTLNQSITSSNETCLEITSNDILLDCKGHAILGNNSTGSIAILSNNRKNISIVNCDIADWDYGVYLNNTNEGYLFNNSIYNNNYGYYFENSSNFTSDFDELDNDLVDIYLNNSKENIFTYLLLGDADLDFAYSGDLQISNVYNAPSDPNNWKGISYIQINSSSANSWLDLDWYYDEADLNGRSENSIVLGRYNSSWETNSSALANNFSINTSDNFVSANITGFDGIFSLLRPYQNPTVGISPASVELNYTENSTQELANYSKTLTYYAVNQGDGANYTLLVNGDLKNYMTLNQTTIFVPTGSAANPKSAPFKVTIDFPDNMTSGKYTSEVIVKYCQGNSCAEAASQLWVYGPEKNPSPAAIGISPAKYTLNFTANQTTTLNFWAVNQGGTGANVTIDKAGDLKDYMNLNTTQIYVPAGSQSNPSSVQFKVNLTFPAYLAAGKYDSEVGLTYCAPNGSGCSRTASTITVYSNATQPTSTGGGGGGRAIAPASEQTNEETQNQTTESIITEPEPQPPKIEEETQIKETPIIKKPNLISTIISAVDLSLHQTGKDKIAVIIPTNLQNSYELVHVAAQDSGVKAIILKTTSRKSDISAITQIIETSNKPFIVLVDKKSSPSEFSLLNSADEIIAPSTALIGSPEVFSNRNYWTGAEAKEIGLVDYLGGLDDAKYFAEELTNMPNLKIVDLEKEKVLLSLLNFWFNLKLGYL